MMEEENKRAVAALRWGENGLIPVVAQDVFSGEVLMLAYANGEAVEQTLQTGYAHYYSRSRQSLWKKGETSGHLQKVREVRHDCDGDTLLYLVEQTGPACHTGAPTCFFTPIGEERAPAFLGRTLAHLAATIAERSAADPAQSYTARLLTEGLDRVLKKVAEESGEVIIAAKNGSEAEIRWETADLLYHLLVVLHRTGVDLSMVAEELEGRSGK